MGEKVPESTAHRPKSTGKKDVFLPPILVTQTAAFRALAISDKLGRRLVRERVIPTVQFPHGPRRVVVDELRKTIMAMVQVDRRCRTCAKRRDVRGKETICAVYGAAPSDIENCKAWTFDENWNIAVVAETNEYQGRVEKKKK